MLNFKKMCVSLEDLEDFEKRDKAAAAARWKARMEEVRIKAERVAEARRLAREDYNRKVAEVACRLLFFFHFCSGCSDLWD